MYQKKRKIVAQFSTILGALLNLPRFFLLSLRIYMLVSPTHRCSALLPETLSICKICFVANDTNPMMNMAFVSTVPLSGRHLQLSLDSSRSARRSSFVPRLLIRAARSTRVQRPLVMALNESEEKAALVSIDRKPSAIDTFWSTARKVLAIVAVTVALALPMDAFAAGGGARMGGSSFRAPAQRSAPTQRSYSPPSYYSPGVPSYGGFGYGYGPSIFLNPFVAPVGVGFGLSGFGGFLAFMAATSVVASLVRARSGSTTDDVSDDPTTTVAVVKVGLLSSARSLQQDLDTLARSADTASTSGLAYLLQETVTSLLRHPDYWAYSSSEVNARPLSRAEGEFNRLALQERLKLKEETLTNTSGRRFESARASARDTDLSKAPSEYIVTSLVVAASGNLVRQMPKNIDSASDLDRALRTFATISADSLQAVEVVWAPQSLRDTLSKQEMLSDHPELKKL